MQKSVHEVVNFEEFYGLIDNELSDEEFDPDNKDEKIKEMIAIALSLLQEFYLEHKYYTAYLVLTDSFEKELERLNVQLKELLLSLFDDYVSKVCDGLDAEYVIPTGLVQVSSEWDKVLESGVDKVTTTLYADLKNKADFYTDVAITTGLFSLHSNFRRAVKQLTNVIDYNAQYVGNRIERDYLGFVYGQDKLFYWNVTGVNTCAWCYDLAGMGAMPLSWFPVDHPNGGCWLTPAVEDDYSDEYLAIRGW